VPGLRLPPEYPGPASEWSPGSPDPPDDARPYEAQPRSEQATSRQPGGQQKRPANGGTQRAGAKSLIEKLEAADKANNARARGNILDAFNAQVSAQAGKSLTPEAGSAPQR
jgi:hypothetical protein